MTENLPSPERTELEHQIVRGLFRIKGFMDEHYKEQLTGQSSAVSVTRDGIGNILLQKYGALWSLRVNDENVRGFSDSVEITLSDHGISGQPPGGELTKMVGREPAAEMTGEPPIFTPDDLELVDSISQSLGLIPTDTCP